jgi:hypothetical protein
MLTHVLKFIILTPDFLLLIYLVFMNSTKDGITVSLIFGGPGILLGTAFGLYQFFSKYFISGQPSPTIKDAFMTYGYTLIGMLISLVLFYGYLTILKKF